MSMTNPEALSDFIERAGKVLLKAREARIKGLQNVVDALRSGKLLDAEANRELDMIEGEYQKAIDEAMKLLNP